MVAQEALERAFHSIPINEHGDDELQAVLAAGLREPAEVYTELLRDYSEFLTELGEVAADGDASDDMLKQLDILDGRCVVGQPTDVLHHASANHLYGSANALLHELDAGVEAVRGIRYQNHTKMARVLIRARQRQIIAAAAMTKENPGWQGGDEGLVTLLNVLPPVTAGGINQDVEAARSEVVERLAESSEALAVMRARQTQHQQLALQQAQQAQQQAQHQTQAQARHHAQPQEQPQEVSTAVATEAERPFTLESAPEPAAERSPPPAAATRVSPARGGGGTAHRATRGGKRPPGGGWTSNSSKQSSPPGARYHGNVGMDSKAARSISNDRERPGAVQGSQSHHIGSSARVRLPRGGASDEGCIGGSRHSSFNAGRPSAQRPTPSTKGGVDKLGQLNTRSTSLSRPKMLTKKMVMQELLLEMHKKWRTMKFVPDPKAKRPATLRGERLAAQAKADVEANAKGNAKEE